jgi:hypothetical protein
MTEDNIEANTALLLDEKIEERIHIAVGKLFGFDATKNYWTPQPLPNTVAHEVRKYFMQEVVREMSRVLVNDHEFVRGMYERMGQIQRDRRHQFNNSVSASQYFF